MEYRVVRFAGPESDHCWHSDEISGWLIALLRDRIVGVGAVATDGAIESVDSRGSPPVIRRL